MAETVDSSALAVPSERANIFVAPEVAPAGTGVEPAHEKSVFAAAGTSLGYSGATGSLDRSRGGPHIRDGARLLANGLGAWVCFAAMVAVAMALLVLHELGSESAVQGAEVTERRALVTTAGTVSARRPTRLPSRRARKQALGTREHLRRRRARQNSARRTRTGARLRSCCRANSSSRRRPASDALTRGRPVVPATPAAPTTPPSPVPAASRDRTAPAPVPAGAPPEFM